MLMKYAKNYFQDQGEGVKSECVFATTLKKKLSGTPSASIPLKLATLPKPPFSLAITYLSQAWGDYALMAA